MKHLAFSLLLLSCAGTTASQGGAQFKRASPEAVALAPEALFAVCWPQDALSTSRIALTFQGDDAIFEARDGASNSTGRCIREIATSVTWPNKPSSLEVAPPSQPIDGWAALAWVKLLSSSRFGPERGLLDPAARVSACITKLGAPAPSTAFIVRPGDSLRTVPPAFNDVDRCIEATLGATAWPSSRELYFAFANNRGAPEPKGDVTPYVSPNETSGIALDPQNVHDALQLSSAKVAACWESALARRGELKGARTIRFTVDDSGAVKQAWFTSTTGQGASASDALLDACLHGVVMNTHFAPRAGDGFYTWVFATR